MHVETWKQTIIFRYPSISSSYNYFSASRWAKL